MPDITIHAVDFIAGSNSTDVTETLSGGLGDDNLWGMGGADYLIGGAGVDTYWFGGTDGADTIAAATNNNQDVVYFWKGGSDFTTTLNGDNLVISFGGSDSLTIVDWNKTDGSKLNNFDFGAAGVWGLSVASDGTTATWTRRS